MNERTCKLLPGLLMIPLFVVIIPGGVVYAIITAVNQHNFWPWGLAAILLVLSWCLGMAGFVIVNPNEARVVQLFGRYVGTLKDQGLYYGNPFYRAQRVSMRVQTFETGQTKTPERKDAQGNVTTSGHTARRPSKVNDKDGTPIEIAAIVVWRIVNTAEAVFVVNDAEEFVHMQSEAALRGLASQYSYDAEEGQYALRGHIDEVCSRLKSEVQERVRQAGVVIEEARISHLAYSPEIASAMLQRQQAGAVIAARAKIVEGAVGMVEHALEMLSAKKIVDFDGDRKAAMVSNLLIVLCGHSVPQPIMNTGTIYQ
ncbi:SPFH domain-containing protein [Zavarzinella formosa]|uniref:SPFH domain-containing protein n=1 Tax=Zavarzinella formosa TaxID=360055 RepID=UPI0003161D44|nr:SPFH domain-containing protein [Zavarzinella formosa]